ncbi:hypothetical protein PPERSA_02104 [Pseudocohnilembus persalinus]|uniref:Mitochondrial cardiolipin hydrolase n=1 Tax=Pseudocohnilembus persalinus TaxID=266149 RepID=A0A0V0Q8F4_PSEPJ|nr:hypothetical protein PPERSA_02104 [Pseudocohnilembus persalinus]|eukprot:KRW98327.1 hypothetical protein PPERSA_02104 [Pseudocohnilembus persalinus]
MENSIYRSNSMLTNSRNDITLFFSRRNPIEKQQKQQAIILDHLKCATKSVKICMYYLLSKSVIQQLLLLDENVKIQIITHSEQTINANAFQNKRNVEIYYLENDQDHLNQQNDQGGLMHHKFAIIDEIYLINGSLNWTNNGIKNNFENVQITKSKNDIKNYSNEFDDLKYAINNSFQHIFPNLDQKLNKKINQKNQQQINVMKEMEERQLESQKQNQPQLYNKCIACNIYYLNDGQIISILQCSHIYCNRCLANQMIKKGDNSQHKSDQCYKCNYKFQLVDYINLQKKYLLNICLLCENVEKANHRYDQIYLCEYQNCQNTQCNQCLIFPYHFDEKCEQQNKSCYFCNGNIQLKLFMEKNQIKICEKCYEKKQDMCLSNLQNDQLCLGEKNHNKCLQNQDQFLMQQESICKLCQNDLKNEKCLQIDCGHIYHIECIKKLNKDELNCLICIEPIKVKDTLQLKCKLCQKNEQKWLETNLILDLIKDEQQMQKKKKIEEYICDQCFHDNSQQNIICQIHKQDDFDFHIYAYKCQLCCNIASNYVENQNYRCDGCNKDKTNQSIQCPGIQDCPLNIKHKEDGSIFLGCQICNSIRIDF